MARRRSTRAPSTRPAAPSPSSEAPVARTRRASAASGGLAVATGKLVNRVRISSGSLPAQRVRSKPPALGPLRPMLSTSGGASPSTWKPRGVGAVAGAAPGASGATGPGGLGPGAWPSGSAGAVGPGCSGNSRIGPCWAASGDAASTSARARIEGRRRNRSDPTRLRRGPARGCGRGAIADTRGQRGNWLSGSTRSTRDVGGGISQVTRNTVPPNTITTSRTRRMRLMVDMIPSDAPRRRRGERVASHPDRRFISTASRGFNVRSNVRAVYHPELAAQWQPQPSLHP